MEKITAVNIREIYLCGFRNQREPVTFSFGDITCASGHNGTGKTTLAHAIAFAFYGVNYYGEQKTDRLMNSQSKICEVRIRFADQNGELHILMRRRTGSKTELFFDSYTVRQEDINRFICDRDTFLCAFNPFYLIGLSADKGRDILLRNLKSVNSAQVLAAMSEGFKKPLEGIELTEPSDMLKSYRAGIRRCDEQLNILAAKRETLRQTELTNDAECKRLNEQAEMTAATVSVLREKQFGGIDTEQFKERRAKLTEILRTSPGGSSAVRIAETEQRLKALREQEYVSKFAGEAAKLDGEISALHERYTALKAKIEGLSAGQKCPVCSVVLTPENLAQVKSELTAEINKVISKARGLSDTRKELSLTDAKSKETFLKFRKDDIEKLSAELDGLRKAQSEEDSPDIIQKEIEEIDLLLSRGLLSDDEYSELKAEEKNLAALEAQIKKLREYSVEDKVAELNSQAAAFESDKHKYTEIVSALGEYISKRTELAAAELKMPNVSITLFETLKTTGELKDVFRFAYKGRDIAALSLSEKTAAGIEIAGLFRRVTGLELPLCVDNTESIAVFDQNRFPQQTILLRMVKGAPLSVRTMNRTAESEALPKAS